MCFLHETSQKYKVTKLNIILFHIIYKYCFRCSVKTDVQELCLYIGKPEITEVCTYFPES